MNQFEIKSKRMNGEAAASYLRDTHGVTVSVNTLAQWRCQKRGPRYHKLPGSNRVFYLPESLDDFVNASVEVKTTID